jgi:adenylate cyclase
VMGDTVNLASRLEGLNQHVGTTVLCSEATARAAGPAVVTRLLGCVAVKGKREGVRIHEPLAAGSDAPTQAAAAAAWNAAFARYLARDFPGAEPAFGAWLAAHPGDEPAARLVRQCRAFAAQPPGPDWNGTVVMTTK